MSEQPANSDVVKLVRQAFDAGNRHDVDAIMGLHAPEAVWDLSDQGLGTFEGVAAIRGWVEDWFGTWADLRLDVLDVVDLGNGVVFSRVREEGRLADGDGHVEQQRGWVILGDREDREGRDLSRHRRGLCCRRTPCRGTGGVMAEESTTPDLVELTRRALEPANRRDFEATVSFYAPDAVWDMSPMGLGTSRVWRRFAASLKTGSGLTRSIEIGPRRFSTSATESSLS